MQSKMSSFLKGVGTGAAIGMVTVVAASTMKNTKTTKRKISNAVKTVSDFMDNVSYMLK